MNIKFVNKLIFITEEILEELNYHQYEIPIGVLADLEELIKMQKRLFNFQLKKDIKKYIHKEVYEPKTYKELLNKALKKFPKYHIFIHTSLRNICNEMVKQELIYLGKNKPKEIYFYHRNSSTFSIAKMLGINYSPQELPVHTHEVHEVKEVKND